MSEQTCPNCLMITHDGFTWEHTALCKKYSNLQTKLDKAREALEAERLEWEAEIAAELISGNIVKEQYARGRVNGIDVALAILAAKTLDEITKK